MSKSKQAKIRWPRTKSLDELERMSKEQGLRYALRLHECHAERHRREMEWDLFWAGFYRQLLRQNRGKLR